MTTHALTVGGERLRCGTYTAATHPRLIKGEGSVVVAGVALSIVVR